MYAEIVQQGFVFRIETGTSLLVDELHDPNERAVNFSVRHWHAQHGLGLVARLIDIKCA
jgi:hypothetical protein